MSPLRSLLRVSALSLLLLPGLARAQSAASVPMLVRIAGSIPLLSGERAGPRNQGVIFALYREQEGGAPLWQEVQTVGVDAIGRFTALLGAATPAGIPAEVFQGSEARWLGVQPQGGPEQPRVLLASVPYAIQAGDAATLGGLPASAFLRAGAAPIAATSGGYANPAAASPAASTIAVSPALSTVGATAGAIPVFTDTAGDLGKSALFQLNTGTQSSPVWNLGLGTATPAFNLQFVSTVDPAAIAIDGYGIVGINYIGRRARGTPSTPTAVLAGDNILALQGRGYGATGFSPTSRANLKFFAAENWSDIAQGTYISLATTARGAASAAERLRIADSGNVGIGTASPANPLSVNGIVQSLSGGFLFPDGTLQTTAATAGAAGVIAITSADSTIAVGGTAAAPTIAVNTGSIQKRVAGSCPPATGATAVNADGSLVCGLTSVASLAAGNYFTLPQTIDVGSNGSVALTLEADNTGSSPNALYAITGSLDANANAVYAVATNAGSSASAVFGQTFGSGVALYGNASSASLPVTAVEGDVASTAGTGIQGYAFAASGSTTAVAGRIRSPQGVALLGSAIAQSCTNTNGVTACTPIAGGTAGKLQTASGGTLLLGQVVDANFAASNVFRVDSAGQGFFNGGVRTSGADFAESVAVDGSRAGYSPGDLITVDPTGDRRFTLVAEPYSTLVAGIYATRPGVIASPHRIDAPLPNSEIPLAVVGIVPCKVSAENGPIRRGDLLVSSSMPGRAMRGSDRNRMLGAVVGKALGPLEHGTGVIEVLVTLQ